MKSFINLFFVLVCLIVKAQENYSTLTQKASDEKSKAKDEAGFRKALTMYEDAFKTFPDSIRTSDYAEISTIASQLEKKDKAFKYLSRLLETRYDEDGVPIFRYFLGKQAEKKFGNLLADDRWKILNARAQTNKFQFYNDLKIKEEEFYHTKEGNLKKVADAKVLYKNIKDFNPFLPKKERNYSISLSIKDTIKNSFLVHLPKNYNPQNRYAVLFFLHGAVRWNTLADYQIAKWNLEGWNRYYTKYADQNNIILIFPNGSKEYNWMKPDDGFYMVPEILRRVKTTLNIDDDRVSISGHSNGATGSFSYLMKQPTEFAGFFGFNTYPKVFTGGTFIENIKNRSLINFSTDKDYYYPPNANDDLTKLMKSIGADYNEYRYNGFPHWFPQFNESEPAYKILFNDIKNRKRNPYPKEILWEFDDNKYGNIDWISNAKLDTLRPKSNWQKELNFKINKWLDYDKVNKDSLIVQNVEKNAFDFPRKSGKIMANYSNNIFKIETSRIKSLSINISPEMVDLNKKVKVLLNGKLIFKGKIDYNRDFIMKNFEKSQDRKQVWINEIKV